MCFPLIPVVFEGIHENPYALERPVVGPERVETTRLLLITNDNVRELAAGMEAQRNPRVLSIARTEPETR